MPQKDLPLFICFWKNYLFFWANLGKIKVLSIEYLPLELIYTLGNFKFVFGWILYSHYRDLISTENWWVPSNIQSPRLKAPKRSQGTINCCIAHYRQKSLVQNWNKFRKRVLEKAKKINKVNKLEIWVIWSKNWWVPEPTSQNRWVPRSPGTHADEAPEH